MATSYPEGRLQRLKTWDYANCGAYFVTAVTLDRLALFGDVRGSEMRLGRLGRIVEHCWHDLATHYENISLDAVCVMPNHVHGIIWMRGAGLAGLKRGAGLAGLKPATTPVDTKPADLGRGTGLAGLKPATTAGRDHGLPEIVRAFKTFSARRVNEARGTAGTPVWQRNYYERVIRDERELNAAREYIETNPLRWHLDKENPERQA